jgi:hypothetical protein
LAYENVQRNHVELAMDEYDELGEEKFLEKYSFGKPTRYYVTRNGRRYAPKAIAGVANYLAGGTLLTGRTSMGGKSPSGANRLFDHLRFDIEVISASISESTVGTHLEAHAYMEGERLLREVSFFQRNPALVRDAKQKYGYICMVCDFNFSEVYGNLGEGYIECHHLDPLSERDGWESDSSLTQLDRVAVLCANCHRMIHRKKPALSLNELIFIVVRD